jgi:hypothetical protein
MAKSKGQNPSSRSRVSFYEVVFAGRPKVVRSFLAGLALGTCRQCTVIFNYDAGIQHEGLGERVSEFVGLRSADCHAVVDARLANLIRKLSGDIEERAGLKVDSCRHIRSAVLPFRFSVYARHYYQQIMELLKDLPPGAKMRDFKEDKEEDPGAKGTEVYSPVHDFEAKGSGKIVGRVDRLVEYRKRLAQQPLIEEADIELVLA